MDLLEAARIVGPAVGLLLALCLLGALVAAPVLGGGHLGLALRLPGNLLHEGAHAVAVLACGFRVQAFRLSLFTAGGRGCVVPGPAWTHLASPTLLRLLAPVAPLPAGIAALGALGVTVAHPLQLTDPWTWGAALLAVSIASEIYPSDVDLRILALPALGALALGVGALAGLGAVAPAASPVVRDILARASAFVVEASLVALQEVGLGLVLVGIPLLLLRRR